MTAKEFISHLALELVDVGIQRVFSDLEEQLARQGITIGM